jgi:thioredoxin reductase (NADPH)
MKADIAIIGAGPAGLSAAMYCARAGKKTLVLRGKAKSRLELGHIIENYPGVETLPGAVLLEKMEKQAVSFGARIINADAVSLNLESEPKMIGTRNEFIEAGALVLAMGRGVSKKTIHGEEKFLGRGVSYCAVCDGALFRGKKTAVYGSDGEALEDAMLLSQIGCEVTLVLGCSSQSCPGLAEKASGNGIILIENASITEVKGSDAVSGVKIKASGSEFEIPVSALFIISDIPSGTLLKDTGIEVTGKDCVVINRNMETNIPGVFAAGDITCGVLQAAAAAGEGVTAALSALKYLRGLLNKGGLAAPG